MNARCGWALRRFWGERGSLGPSRLHTLSCFPSFLNPFTPTVLHGETEHALVRHARSGGSGGVRSPSAERAEAVASVADISLVWARWMNQVIKASRVSS